MGRRKLKKRKKQRRVRRLTTPIRTRREKNLNPTRTKEKRLKLVRKGRTRMEKERKLMKLWRKMRKLELKGRRKGKNLRMRKRRMLLRREQRRKMRKKNHQTSSLLGKCSSLPRWSTLSSWRLERVTRFIFKKGSVQPCMHLEKSALRTRTTSKLLMISKIV